MLPSVYDLAWQKNAGKVIEHLDKPDFWRILVRIINKYVAIDNWVSLIFSDDAPHVIDFAEKIFESDVPDPLISDYVSGLYLLDPFYISNRDCQESGLVHLIDIAPEHFLKTEYYNRYFTHYVFTDEVQYNTTLDSSRTLSLSLGSREHYKQEQIALLDMIGVWAIPLMRQRMHFETGLTRNASKFNIQWQDSLDESLLNMGTPLTSREIDILRLLLSGFSNKEMASKISLSVETVKVHRRNLYGKLQIKSHHELFLLFLRGAAR